MCETHFVLLNPGHGSQATSSLDSDRTAETGHRNSPFWNSAHPEGGCGNALPEGLGQAALCHRNLCHGHQHASQDSGL